MNTRDADLGDFIIPHGKGLSDTDWLKIISSAGVIAVLASFGPDALEGVKAGLRSSISTLFQVSLLDVLLGGWEKYRDVTKSIEASRKSPKDPVLQPLASHTVKSTHHPYVELFKDERPVGKIQFDLTAALKVEGLTLQILNGEVSQILAGSCQGSVQLAYDSHVLIEGSTEQIQLRGSIPLKPSAVQTVVAKRRS